MTEEELKQLNERRDLANSMKSHQASLRSLLERIEGKDVRVCLVIPHGQYENALRPYSHNEAEALNDTLRTAAIQLIGDKIKRLDQDFEKL